LLLSLSAVRPLPGRAGAGEETAASIITQAGWFCLKGARPLVEGHVIDDRCWRALEEGRRPRVKAGREPPQSSA
jgi:hypothetical protein